jgi:tetratricopeptide (TPR) repeat protein
VAQAYHWKYVPEPMGAANALMLIENVQGTDPAIEFYKKLKQGANPEYRVDESSLNTMGYHLLMQKRMDEAIKVFKLNVEEYPNAWNPYDSLGEAYMKAGQKELAIKSYEKSLELNPDNKNGTEMLKKLRGE